MKVLTIKNRYVFLAKLKRSRKDIHQECMVSGKDSVFYHPTTSQRGKLKRRHEPLPSVGRSHTIPGAVKREKRNTYSHFLILSYGAFVA